MAEQTSGSGELEREARGVRGVERHALCESVAGWGGWDYGRLER